MRPYETIADTILNMMIKADLIQNGYVLSIRNKFSFISLIEISNDSIIFPIINGNQIVISLYTPSGIPKTIQELVDEINEHPTLPMFYEVNLLDSSLGQAYSIYLQKGFYLIGYYYTYLKCSSNNSQVSWLSEIKNYKSPYINNSLLHFDVSSNELINVWKNYGYLVIAEILAQKTHIKEKLKSYGIILDEDISFCFDHIALKTIYPLPQDGYASIAIREYGSIKLAWTIAALNPYPFSPQQPIKILDLNKLPADILLFLEQYPLVAALKGAIYVDLYLNENSEDIEFKVIGNTNQYQDVYLVYNEYAVKQWLRLNLTKPLGYNIFHPELGCPIQLGRKMVDWFIGFYISEMVKRHPLIKEIIEIKTTPINESININLVISLYNMDDYLQMEILL